MQESISYQPFLDGQAAMVVSWRRKLKRNGRIQKEYIKAALSEFFGTFTLVVSNSFDFAFCSPRQKHGAVLRVLLRTTHPRRDAKIRVQKKFACIPPN